MTIANPKYTVLDKVGDFPVEQVPVQHYPETVDFDRPRCGVLHTTEGGWEGSLDILTRHSSPHFMLGLHKGKPEIVQFIPVGFIGAALKSDGHHNYEALVQIEMVGFSKEKLWLPDADTLDVLASLMVVCEHEWGIPLSHPFPDGVYGMARRNTPTRNSGKFGHIAGWYGHGDVPDNDHWDPGAIQWSKIFARCRELEAEGTGV